MVGQDLAMFSCMCSPWWWVILKEIYKQTRMEFVSDNCSWRYFVISSMCWCETTTNYLTNLTTCCTIVIIFSISVSEHPRLCCVFDDWIRIESFSSKHRQTQRQARRRRRVDVRVGATREPEVERWLWCLSVGQSWAATRRWMTSDSNWLPSTDRGSSNRLLWTCGAYYENKQSKAGKVKSNCANFHPKSKLISLLGTTEQAASCNKYRNRKSIC